MIILFLVQLNNTFSAGYIQPIPIWAWEIDLSESWLKGICDHASDEDHMGSEHIYFLLIKL